MVDRFRRSTTITDCRNVFRSPILLPLTPFSPAPLTLVHNHLFIMTRFFLLLAVLSLTTCTQIPDAPADQAPDSSAPAWTERTSANASAPTARHEAAFVAVNDKAYLLGGRGVKPVDIYDLKSGTWTSGDSSPAEREALIKIALSHPAVGARDLSPVGGRTKP